MIRFLAVALSLGAVIASDDICAVGDWSEWSECQSPKSCDRSYVTAWNVPAATMDKGRTKMEMMMREKELLNQQKAACKADGSCPELMPKTTEGFRKCVNGLAGNLPCRNIDQLSFVSIEDLGYAIPDPSDNNPRGNDIWGWTDPINGDEYAIMGLSGGTSFVRITNPTEPETLAFLPTHTVASTWRDMKVIDHYAYIVSEARDHGMQVFDLHRLRGQSDFQRVEADAHYSRVGNTHNIVSNEETGYVYLVGSTRNTNDYTLCAGGLHVVDVRDPLNPQFAGCFGDDGYVHDAQCLNYDGPDTRYTGREICFCYNEDSFTIVDVTDKNDMSLVSKKGYSGVQYTHQGWATIDLTTVLLDDELDESRNLFDKRTKTYIWDIRDLTDPILKSRYDSTETSIDHNQYVVGDLTYQSNYEAGLRILYIDVNPEANIYDLEELAYFDVFPSRTTAQFSGSWSVYPYFPSGNLVLSSIEFGLYVLRADSVAMEADRLKNSSYGEQKRFREIISNQNNAVCPPLMETTQCQPDVTC